MRKATYLGAGETLAREVDAAERNVWEFAGERCDRIVARVLSRIRETADGGEGGIRTHETP
jgi:hypothetical protein